MHPGVKEINSLCMLKQHPHASNKGTLFGPSSLCPPFTASDPVWQLVVFVPPTSNVTFVLSTFSLSLTAGVSTALINNGRLYWRCMKGVILSLSTVHYGYIDINPRANRFPFKIPWNILLITPLKHWGQINHIIIDPSHHSFTSMQQLLWQLQINQHIAIDQSLLTFPICMPSLILRFFMHPLS